MSIVAILSVCIFSYLQRNTEKETPQESIAENCTPTTIDLFGFDNTVHYESSVINYNQFLGTILSEAGLNSQIIAELEEKAKDVFDVRNIRVGKNYHLVRKDSCENSCLAFVYEAHPLKYVVYDFQDSIDVRIVERDYEICQETVTGTIESSLWMAMVDQGVNPGVIDLMEDALSSQVSFYHTQKGDRFKAIFEKKVVDGKEVGLGNIVGAYFENDYGQYYSVYFENEAYEGFYDLEGRPSKKSFLKSPIRAGRISSRYNLRRLHPIKKRRIPHLGTDYAAPYGTPIHSVADGIVTVVSRKANNGNYVKVKHDDTYTSQYLHMQKFKSGLKPGMKVKQGETIGYVGSTGLATGPHVCFRFWKHGKQIDHLRENFPPAEPLPQHDLDKFNKLRDAVKKQLDDLDFHEAQTDETTFYAAEIPFINYSL